MRSPPSPPEEKLIQTTTFTPLRRTVASCAAQRGAGTDAPRALASSRTVLEDMVLAVAAAGAQFTDQTLSGCRNR